MDALKPLRTRIVDDVVSTLQTVLAQTGYYDDLIVEKPSPANGNRVRDNLVVVVGGNQQRVEDEAQNFVGWDLAVHCIATCIQSESSTTGVDERLDIIAADIEKALTQDPSHTRGGLAIDTEAADFDFGEIDLAGSMGQVVVTVMVRMRYLYGDPYSQ
jgi:hypothetical protein